MAGKKSHIEWTYTSSFLFLRTIAHNAAETVDTVSQIIDLTGSNRGCTNIIYVSAAQAVANAAAFFTYTTLTIHLFYNVLSNISLVSGDPAISYAWSRIATASGNGITTSAAFSFTGLPAGQYKIVVPAAVFTNTSGTANLLYSATA